MSVLFMQLRIYALDYNFIGLLCQFILLDEAGYKSSDIGIAKYFK